MQIHLRHSDADGAIKIVLVELQGSLVTANNDLQSLTIGDLSISSNGNPVLTIGNHRLDGEIVPLAKPYAVLRKQRLNTDKPGNDKANMNDDTISLSAQIKNRDDNGDNKNNQLARLHRSMVLHELVEYTVISIVRERYLFKDRPEHVVTAIRPLKRARDDT